jgi:hypothetical protein
MLQTPLNPMFSGLDGKEGRDIEGELESFPILDWSACASPPLTPGRSTSSFLWRSFEYLILCHNLAYFATSSKVLEARKDARNS